MMNQEDLLIFTKDNIEEDKKKYYGTNFSIEYLNILIINALLDINASFKGKSKTLLINEFKEKIQKGYEVKLDDEAFRNYFINNNDFKVIDDKISLVNINDFFLKNIHLDLDRFDEWGPHNNLDDLLLMYANSARENGLCDIKSVVLIFIMRYKQEHASYENISVALLEFLNAQNSNSNNFYAFQYEEYGLIPTDAIFKDLITRRILLINGITHIRDFRKYDIKEINSMLLTNLDDKERIYILAYGHTKFFMDLDYIFTKCEDELTLKIVYLYNGFLGEQLTLAEIAKRFKITIKEVLNRIDAFYNYYNERLGTYGNDILHYFYKSFEKNKTYCSRLDLLKSIKNLPYEDYDYTVPLSLFYKFLFSAIKYGCYPIKYDKDLDIIYDSTLTSIDIIIEERILELGKVIRLDEFDDLSRLDYMIVEKYYFKRTSKLFAKKNMSDNEILLEIWDKEFMNRPIYSFFYNLALSREYLLYSYGEGLDYSTLETFKDKKLKFRIEENPSEYINYKNYILVNDNTLILNEMFKIPNNKLEIIRKNIRLLVARFGEYNAKEIENHNHGYPHLGYPWNKYLLCSIVSRYFSDEFKVVNVTNEDRTREYIIKSCK